MPLNTQSYLTKYGWKLGSGLGKNEDGLANAIKSLPKVSNSGVGCRETFNNPFEDAFNHAAKNIDIIEEKGGVVLKQSEGSKSEQEARSAVYGGSFTKSGTALVSIPSAEVTADGLDGRPHLFHDRCKGKLKRLAIQEATVPVDASLALLPAGDKHKKHKHPTKEVSAGDVTLHNAAAVPEERKKKKKNKSKMATGNNT